MTRRNRKAAKFSGASPTSSTRRIFRSSDRRGVQDTNESLMNADRTVKRGTGRVRPRARWAVPGRGARGVTDLIGPAGPSSSQAGDGLPVPSPGT
eukprot:755599-Hanusia_phi.AAC.2